MKEKWEIYKTTLEESKTMSKKEFLLIITVCVLGGMVIGMLFSPRKHTTIGAKIIKDVQSLGENNEFLQMSYDIANAHHERWDGTEYPNGLNGREIPLAAQIVSIVGSYCALTEERAYRGAFSKDEALNIMEEDVGIYFNPEIYKILKMIKRQLK